MASIHTHAHFIIKFNAVKDFFQFFKTATYFCTFTCHCFKQNCCCHIGCKYSIKLLYDKINSDFNALSDVTARMEVVKLVWCILHTS